MKKALLVIFIGLLGIALAAWFGVNNYILPRIVVPEITKWLKDTTQFEMKDLEVDIFRGLIIKDIELKGIVKAKEIDVDLNFLPLFFKKIEIGKINILGGEVDIKRDRKGKWNFTPLLKLMEGKEGGKEEYEVVIREVRLHDGRIKFADRLHGRNQLVRDFENIDASIRFHRRDLFDVTFIGGAADEAVDLKFTYDQKKDSLKGEVSLKTVYLTKYWDYYLDEIFRPFHVRAKEVVLKTKFDLVKDDISLDGEYLVKGGVVEHGDLLFTGEAKVAHRQKFRKLKPVRGTLGGEVELSELSFSPGKQDILSKGKILASLTDKAVIFRKITGLNPIGKPIDLTGRLELYPKTELTLTGMIGEEYDNFRATLYGADQAIVNWSATQESSRLAIYARFKSIKDLVFDLNLTGDIRIKDLEGISSFHFEVDPKVDIPKDLDTTIHIGKDDLDGRVTLNGYIRGEADKYESFTGGIMIRLKDLRIYKWEPRDFALDMKVEKGVFAARIPVTEFYGGKLFGFCVMDSKRWALELNLDNCDISTLVKTSPKLSHMKGILSLDISCAAEWADITTLRGGGYVDLKDADLRSAPFFQKMEKEIAKVTPGFTLPPFSAIEANFDILDKQVKVPNGHCVSHDLSLEFSGKYSFDGRADFTGGLKFLGGPLKTLRQIFFPVTIPFDIAANTIRINLSGDWPNYNFYTSIEPMRWLDAFRSSSEKIDPKRYDIDKVWYNK